MSTMLPFTSTDLVIAAVTVGALIALAMVVFLIARLRPTAVRTMTPPVSEPETAVSAAPAATAGAVQHA